MDFIKGRALQQDTQLKRSFFQLAKDTFQFEFTEWDALGYWDDSYCPYAFAENGEIVANVSVSIGTMIVDGKVHQVVQLGTVMTKPSYQQRGYISKLMSLVLEDVQSADFVYVFANKNVLELYQKFGFEQRRQAKFRLQTKDLHVQPTDVKKLDMTEPKARALLYEMLMHRMPVSLAMSMLQNETIVMYHALTAYKECIYYVPSLQTIVIAQEIAETLHIIDVISKRPVHVLDVLQQLPITLPTIELGFTPDMLSVVQQTPLLVGDTLFVKVQNDCIYPDDVRFPVSGLA